MEDMQASKPHLSGSLSGHLVPGSFFLAVGSFFLGLTFVRCRALAKDSGEHSDNKKNMLSKYAGGHTGITTLFCKSYIPEPNFKIIHHAGYVLMILSIVGIIFEGGGGILTRENGTFFSNAGHQTLYALFIFVGLAARYESNHIFPIESMRWAVALAEFGCYLLWNEHALHKKDYLDIRVHTIMAQLCLMSCISFIWSISSPRNFVAYVTSLCTISLQGSWLITLGINVNHPMSHHNIGVFIVLEILAHAFIVALCGIYCANLQRESLLRDRQYTSIPVDALDGKNNRHGNFVIDDDDDTLPSDSSVELVEQAVPVV